MRACITCSKPASHGICTTCVERAEAIMYAVTPWTPFVEVKIHPGIASEGFQRSFKNSRYTVYWRDVPSDYGHLVHLSIKRVDLNPIHDWRDMQRIKNEILGPEEEAMELYPAESRLMDTANQYHLWAFLGMRAPFGYESQRIVMEQGEIGGKQRPFEEKPADITTEAEWQEKYDAYKAKQVVRAGLIGQIKSLLDEAIFESGCRNTLRPSEGRCEIVDPDSPSFWCVNCFAQLLKKLAVEAGVIQC